MNVIIANRRQELLENLGIDIIKEMKGEFTVDEIVSTFQNFFYQRMIIDITAIKNYINIENLQKLSISLDMDKVILVLDESPEINNPVFLSKLVSMGIYNFTKSLEGIQYLYNTPNTYRDVAQYQDLTIQTGQQQQSQQVQQTIVTPTIQKGYLYDEPKTTRILGVKNITKQSGASTFIYMMKNELAKNYKVIAMEVDKSDFTYFRDSSLISVVSNDVGKFIQKNSDKDIILVDINNSIVAEGFCGDVLYLIEPSIIKLEKLVRLNPTSMQNLKDKKIVLNKSLLTSSDIANFEYESKLKVFYNMPPLNERNRDIPEIKELLEKLGFTK